MVLIPITIQSGTSVVSYPQSTLTLSFECGKHHNDR